MNAKHLRDELILFARGPAGRGDHGRPMAQRIQRALEADARQGHLMEVGAALHEAADQVIGDAMQGTSRWINSGLLHRSTSIASKVLI